MESTAAEAATGSSSDRSPIAASSSCNSHQKQHKEEKQDHKLAAKGKALSSKRKAATSKQSVVAPDKNEGSSDSDTPSKRIKRRDSESSVKSELLTHPSDAKQPSSSSKKRSLSASSDDSVPSPKPARTTRGAARRTRSQDTAAEQYPTAGSSSGVAEKRGKGGKGSNKPKEEEVKEEPQEDNKPKASSSTASGRGQRKGQQKKGKEPLKKSTTRSSRLRQAADDNRLRLQAREGDQLEAGQTWRAIRSYFDTPPAKSRNRFGRCRLCYRQIKFPQFSCWLANHLRRVHHFNLPRPPNTLRTLEDICLRKIARKVRSTAALETLELPATLIEKLKVMPPY